MRFELLFGWFLMLPVILAAVGYLTWQMYLTYRAKHTWSMISIRRAIAMLLLACMILGPSIPTGTSSPGIANLDVLFTVDTTSSMGALDYNGTNLRLDGAKQDIAAIAAQLKGAHFTLMTFDSKAAVVVPFTTDIGSLTAGLQTTNREIYGTSNGSAIDKPIDLIAKQLKDSRTAHPERNRLLFYLGDGEQTTNSKVKSYSRIASLLNGGAVMGYGTAAGARMVKHTGLENPTAQPTDASYITTLDPATKQFVPAISKLDEPALRTIASELRLPYANRNSGGEINNLVSKSHAPLLVDQSKHIKRYLNLYWLFATPFVVLIFWEWQRIAGLTWQLYLQKRKEIHA